MTILLSQLDIDRDEPPQWIEDWFTLEPYRRDDPPRAKRYDAYRSCARTLDYSKRRRLPEWLVAAIRARYPEPDGNYVGYISTENEDPYQLPGHFDEEYDALPDGDSEDEAGEDSGNEIGDEAGDDSGNEIGDEAGDGVGNEVGDVHVAFEQLHDAAVVGDDAEVDVWEDIEDDADSGEDQGTEENDSVGSHRGDYFIEGSEDDGDGSESEGEVEGELRQALVERIHAMSKAQLRQALLKLVLRNPALLDEI